MHASPVPGARLQLLGVTGRLRPEPGCLSSKACRRCRSPRRWWLRFACPRCRSQPSSAVRESWRYASTKSCIPYMPEWLNERPPPLVLYGKASARGGIAVLPQRVALAARSEAQHFRSDGGGGDRERVVDHRHFHVLRTEPSLLYAVAEERLADVAVKSSISSMSGAPWTRRRQRPRPDCAQAAGDLRPRDDDRAAVVGGRGSSGRASGARR